MSIDATNGAGQVRGVIHEFRRPRPAPSTADQSSPTADQAGITDTARRLNRAQPAVEGAPEVREDRVQALKEALASGTYRSDDREVARKLLDRGF